MNEKAIATYLKEVEKGIPKPEEHQINKQYN